MDGALHAPARAVECAGERVAGQWQAVLASQPARRSSISQPSSSPISLGEIEVGLEIGMGSGRPAMGTRGLMGSRLGARQCGGTSVALGNGGAAGTALAAALAALAAALADAAAVQSSWQAGLCSV